MSKRNINFRLDLVLERKYNKETNSFEYFIKPHPRRYEWKKHNDKQFLYDKLDNIYFPADVFKKMIDQLHTAPLIIQKQKIDSAEDYVNKRLSHIRDMLKGNVVQEEPKDKSEEFLSSLHSYKLEFAILSFDIVKSTLLSNLIPPEKYNRLIKTILYEISLLVSNFHGHVLKYTGDGLIAYFPSPSFIRMNDLAIDCACAIQFLIYKGINPILNEEGFQSIDVRIGIDSGAACIETIGSSETKRHTDIIGSVVNLATKIQSIAGAGRIALGHSCLIHLHTIWREICEEIDVNGNWPYKDKEGNAYRVYRVIQGKRLKSITGEE